MKKYIMARKNRLLMVLFIPLISFFTYGYDIVGDENTCLGDEKEYSYDGPLFYTTTDQYGNTTQNNYILSWNVTGGRFAGDNTFYNVSNGTTKTVKVTWNHPEESPTLTLNVAGQNYSMAVTIYHTEDFMTVTPDQTINKGETRTLAAYGADSYVWANGGLGSSIFVSPSLTTTYSVEGTKTYATGATCSESHSIKVTVIVIPPITGNIICCGQSDVCSMVAPIGGQGSPLGGTLPYTYTWEKSTTSPTATDFTTVATGDLPYAPPLPTVATYYRRKIVGSESGGSPSYSNVATITPIDGSKSILPGTYPAQTIRAHIVNIASTISSSGTVIVDAIDGIDITQTSDITGTFDFKISPCAPGTRMAADDEGSITESEVTLNLFTVFPNPNAGSFTLAFPDESANYSVVITDILGNQVYNDSVNEVTSKEYSLSNLSSGLYLVNVSGGGKNYHEKVQIIR